MWGARTQQTTLLREEAASQATDEKIVSLYRTHSLSWGGTTNDGQQPYLRATGGNGLTQFD